MEQTLAELIELIRDMAPAVYEVYRRQVYLVAAGYTAWSALFGLSAYLLARWAKQGDFELEMDAGLLKAIAVACLIFAVWIFLAVPGRLINPDYYVIQALLEAVRGS